MLSCGSSWPKGSSRSPSVFCSPLLNPAHEQYVRERILALGGESAPLVSLSSEVLPEYREYERTSTTVINAYVAPLMSRYLANLEEGLAGRRLRIMQSNGGTISAECRPHAGSANGALGAGWRRGGRL